MLEVYQTYNRNRINKACGGISTSVAIKDAHDCVRLEEGKDANEYILTRHSQFEKPINVLNIYGNQECRMSNDEIDKQWNEILEIISSVEARNEL